MSTYNLNENDSNISLIIVKQLLYSKYTNCYIRAKNPYKHPVFDYVICHTSMYIIQVYLQCSIPFCTQNPSTKSCLINTIYFLL